MSFECEAFLVAQHSPGLIIRSYVLKFPIRDLVTCFVRRPNHHQPTLSCRLRPADCPQALQFQLNSLYLEFSNFVVEYSFALSFPGYMFREFQFDFKLVKHHILRDNLLAKQLISIIRSSFLFSNSMRCHVEFSVS